MQVPERGSRRYRKTEVTATGVAVVGLVAPCVGDAGLTVQEVEVETRSRGLERGTWKLA